MNVQHKLNIIGNRLRRARRKIIELKADQVHEISRAKEFNREPDLSGIRAAICRLENRVRELAL